MDLPCMDPAQDPIMDISLVDYLQWGGRNAEIAEIPFTRPINPCRVFSDTYEQARSRFREAAHAFNQALQARLAFGQQLNRTVLLHSLNIQENYTMDIAVIPGNQPGLVIHTSGVHGVEGYAGSAIQIAYLHLLRRFYEDGQLIHHPTVVLVHAFNPVGMAGYRRTNENNVDLNRNGLSDAEWKEETLVKSAFNGDLYDWFGGLLDPNQTPTNWSAGIGFVVKFVFSLIRHGSWPLLKRGKEKGQYHNPQGIFYGGRDQVEPSLMLLKDWLVDFLEQSQNADEKDDHTRNEAQDVVTWIDVHTGVGHVRDDSLSLTSAGVVWTDGNKVVAYLAKHFPGPELVGYDKVRGTMNDYFHPLFTDPQQQALILTQHLGTVSPIFVGHALMVENAAYQHMPPQEALGWATKHHEAGLLSAECLVAALCPETRCTCPHPSHAAFHAAFQEAVDYSIPSNQATSGVFHKHTKLNYYSSLSVIWSLLVGRPSSNRLFDSLRSRLCFLNRSVFPVVVKKPCKMCLGIAQSP